MQEALRVYQAAMDAAWKEHQTIFPTSPARASAAYQKAAAAARTAYDAALVQTFRERQAVAS